MTNTLMVLGVFAAMAITFAAVLGWLRFCWRVSDGEIWGCGMFMMPVPIIALTIAIVKDLSV